MSTVSPPVRIAIVGVEEPVSPHESRGCGLWPPGYASAVTAAGGTPVEVECPKPAHTWDDQLEGVDGVLLLSSRHRTPRQVHAEAKLCEWCKKCHMPLLAVDRGLIVMNAALGGHNFEDVAREQPQALQHRHPPEKGLRHAIMVHEQTRLAALYGEGEIVVNSEHRHAVDRPARGFRVCAVALDGIIEALEWEGNEWFAMGVQWQPASASASGLDIQVFRGLVNAGQDRLAKARPPRIQAEAAA